MTLSPELTDAERRALNNRVLNEPKSPEILCDHPGCENVATELLGIVRELNWKFVVCAEHLTSAAAYNEK